MAIEKDTPTAFRETAQRGKTAAAEDALKLGEATTRRAADAVRTMTEDGVEVGRAAAGAGGEMAKRGMGTLRQTIGASAGNAAGAATDTPGAPAAASTAQATGEGVGQIQRLFAMTGDAQGEAAQQARSNMDAMLQCGTVMLDGWQAICREWMGLAQDATARNLEGLNALARSRSVPALYVAQSRLMKDGMELLLSRSVRLSQLSAQTADNAARHLTARSEATAGRTAGQTDGRPG